MKKENVSKMNIKKRKNEKYLKNIQLPTLQNGDNHNQYVFWLSSINHNAQINKMKNYKLRNKKLKNKYE